jgi:hypothetical protein
LYLGLCLGVLCCEVLYAQLLINVLRERFKFLGLVFTGEAATTEAMAGSTEHGVEYHCDHVHQNETSETDNVDDGVWLKDASCCKQVASLTRAQST